MSQSGSKESDSEARPAVESLNEVKAENQVEKQRTFGLIDQSQLGMALHGHGF